MQADPELHQRVLDALDHVRARRPAHADILGAWRRAEHRAQLALTRWHTAPIGLRRDAYAVYTAALDQEAQAAEMLRFAVG
jgi:hypothetical protein